MKNCRIVGVSRGNEFSPNYVENDAAIFNKVVAELQKKGCETLLYTEKEFVAQNIDADVVFNMARDSKTVSRLKALEDQGALVINSAYGISNCIRKPLTEFLMADDIPHPVSYIISADEPFSLTEFPYWLKRGNSHAMVKEDVVFVECREEAELVLADFRRRNIPEVVVNKHLIGDLVKFYGVCGVDFFYSFYPFEQSHSKFGIEAINGKARGYSFDRKKLQMCSERISKMLDVPIYGGDCIVSSSGEFQIIDFNDWPSFARCREEAGNKIAEYIFKKITDEL